ncbi:hypothetical protein K2173_003880 [Erythroxylum novogranatense]|uniref:Protein MICROTUBULE BINDING PROTEIN 2C-like n=1 Tax=Erythroxylum novogranatense TaxID=1862640 RepID=A0AAV8SJJ6_9ROSI|nr:hypothetical protein K2173_003880 [Erythroxylum novogranatense]
MYEPHNSTWLTAGDDSSPTHSQLAVSAAASGSRVDPVLYNDLVQMFPLVESLIDRKVNNSFTRRGSMIYTKTPTRQSLSRKMIDPRGRNAAQSMPMKKKKDPGDKEQGKYVSNNQDGDGFSIYSSKNLGTEKDMEELVMLREQVEDMRKKLLEKDELLKSAEVLKSQMNSVHAKFNELKQETEEKNSLIEATQLQLYDTRIKLADKQAALEKTQWEAMTSNKRAEKLQEELNFAQGGISSLMMLFDELTKNDSATVAEDYDVKPYCLDYLQDLDDLDDMQMIKMEEARQAYIAAIAALTEKRDEESLAAANFARLHLQSFVFRSDSLSLGKDTFE